MSRFEFERIDLAITSPLTNHPHVIGVKVQLWPRWSIWVFVPVSHLQPFNWLYSYRQLTVSIVVSGEAVFRLVDNLMPSRLQIVHWHNYKLKLLANWNRDTGTQITGTNHGLYSSHLMSSVLKLTMVLIKLSFIMMPRIIFQSVVFSPSNRQIDSRAILTAPGGLAMERISTRCCLRIPLTAVRRKEQGMTRMEKGKVCFYTAQYPVRWPTQSALHFTPLVDLFIPTPTQFLWEAF